MLNPAHLIQKKRDGHELTREEIRYFIGGVTSGEVEDYQATAFLMATYFKGMTTSETVSFTEAMVASGEQYELASVHGPKVDKHSTGGVGDKVSLILAPLAAACGLKVPMMAGRGLGHSGGTLDKLESITGFSPQISRARFEEILKKVGCAIIGQSSTICPADKKLYSLRDVTATIECTPIICGSILSKKIAEGAEALVLDVKVGSGAFMKTIKEARELSRALIGVAKKLGLPCRALITNMSQPLGYTAGNALEVRECIEVMTQTRAQRSPEFSSADLKELTLQLCAHMLVLGKISRNLSEGRKLAAARLTDGSAWKYFREMVAAQGGDLDLIDHPERLQKAPVVVQWKAGKRGIINKMDTELIGKILVELGGGRKKVTDTIDFGVGMEFHKKLGARVQPGDPIVTVHAPEGLRLETLEADFHAALEISSSRKPVPKLVLDTL